MLRVVVVDDRIADVGVAGDRRVPRGARTIDGRGTFIIPGLWDTHAHLVSTEARVE